MTAIRQTFLGAAGQARDLIAAPEVTLRWNAGSVLPGWTVAGLAGHLARCVHVVEAYLDAPAPNAPEPISSWTYYMRMLDPDPAATINREIRERGEIEGSVGQERLVADLDSAIERLRARLPRESSGRVLAVRGGFAIRLDDYLKTRLVEAVIHTDDLAASVGVPTPLSIGAAGAVIHELVDLARARHGDLAVLRALSRRERMGPEILRGF